MKHGGTTTRQTFHRSSEQNLRNRLGIQPIQHTGFVPDETASELRFVTIFHSRGQCRDNQCLAATSKHN